MNGLIRSAKKGGRCKALIYTSGVSIYGDHGDKWVDEDAPLYPGAVGSMKLAGEKMTMEAFRDGLPAFSLRPGLVYACSGVFESFFLAQAAKHKFNYIGTGKAFNPSVYLGDLAQAYALTLENPPVGQTLNIVDDEPLRWCEFGQILLDALGGGKPKGAPPWLVSIFAGKPLVEMLTSSYRVKNAKAKEFLKWKPEFPTFREGIKKVASDYGRGR